MLKFGVAGLGLTGLCCFTPLLLWLLPAVGLGAWIAGLDKILLPLLAVFAVLTAYGLWQRQKSKAA